MEWEEGRGRTDRKGCSGRGEDGWGGHEDRNREKARPDRKKRVRDAVVEAQ